MGPLMRNRTQAGGCFLTICILAGFPLGLAIGNPMKGVLIGTGVGIAAAVLLWLIDSRKAR
jgi:dolichyl-phosphate-mannose--protein O-mannosyl transferase